MPLIINRLTLTATILFYILEHRMNSAPRLRPQDVVVVLKLLAHGSKTWTYSEIAKEIGLSPSQAFSAVSRAASSGLLHFPALQNTVNRRNLKEFLIHGVRYAFPVYRGTMTRGIPTSCAAPPLNRIISHPPEPPPVWPYAEGSVRGVELSPLYKTVPKAAQRDPKLYELLALVDAIREGRAREREIAIGELGTRIDTI
jgi:hypothetical protein